MDVPIALPPADPERPSRGGFTLLEALVVLAIVVVLAAVGVPALQLLMTRSKLQGSAREIAVHLGSSRVAALRLGRNVVVQPQFSKQRLLSFVDDNDNYSWDAGEKELSSLPLPGSGSTRGVFMMGPDGIAGTDVAPGLALDGLTPAGAKSNTVPVAVFQPDGSIIDAGGVRVSDGKSPANVFEVRIDPPATARVEILKFVYGDTDGIVHNGEESLPGSWFPQGGNAWEWY